jgi:hypothetical protein
MTTGLGELGPELLPRLLNASRQEIILAGYGGRTKLGELRLPAHAGEEWIRI